MSFRHLTEEDVAAVAELVKRYYAEDSYPFDREACQRALRELVTAPRLGQAWVVEVEREIVGYLVVTLGFSLEYLGLDAFVDELYLREPFRGRGLGREALDLAERYCREVGVRALHLEVEQHRESARRLYATSGFEATGRELLTKRL